MKLSSIFTYLILVTSFNIFGQESDILEYKDISINGINWKSNKNELTAQFGKPDSIYNPKFECGFYSTEQQGIDSVLFIHYRIIDFLIVDNLVVFRDIYFDSRADSRRTSLINRPLDRT